MDSNQRQAIKAIEFCIRYGASKQTLNKKVGTMKFLGPISTEESPLDVNICVNLNGDMCYRDVWYSFYLACNKNYQFEYHYPTEIEQWIGTRRNITREGYKEIKASINNYYKESSK